MQIDIFLSEMNNTFITGPARGSYIPTIKKKDTVAISITM